LKVEVSNAIFVFELLNLVEMKKMAGLTLRSNANSLLCLLTGKGPFVAGPHLNIYHANNLRFLAPMGVRHRVMVPELAKR
jgi:hypothetical protein